MQTVPDVTGHQVFWGACFAFLGVVVSAISKNWGADRRDAARIRRADDQKTATECERLREVNARLHAEVAGLQAMLFAKGIPLPPRIGDSE